MTTLTARSNALYDSQEGLLPVKVLAIKPRLGKEGLAGKTIKAVQDIMVHVEFKSNSIWYTKGVTAWVHSTYVFPTGAVKKKKDRVFEVKPYLVEVQDDRKAVERNKED
jgi:hypothetical protein